ncbi:hypothetical protein [uncultured Lamprocystis sp.]|jgi:hypothetical protein|uniref:hypothetical protein n=1 Tax=uncultured Lamprocystis sp. TaxID=543132 RepID=UPI0025EEB4AF|nr:hypothetical protein [uncultured Lamprocystis sp.]
MKETEKEKLSTTAILKDIIKTWPILPPDQETARLHEEVKREWTAAFSAAWKKKIIITQYFPFYPNDEAADEDEIIAISKQDILTLFESAVLISLYGPVPTLIETVKCLATTIPKDILRGRLNPRNPIDGRVFIETTEMIDPEWTITRAELEEYSDTLFSGSCSVKGSTINEKEKRWNSYFTDRERLHDDNVVRHKDRRLQDTQDEALNVLVNSLEQEAIEKGQCFDRNALRYSKEDLLKMLKDRNPRLFSGSLGTFQTFWSKRRKGICSVISGRKPKSV